MCLTQNAMDGVKFDLAGPYIEFREEARSALLQLGNGVKFDLAGPYNEFREEGTEVIWYKTVWEKSIVPKHGFILWLAVQERLLTKDKIHFDELDPKCHGCPTCIETHKHLFFKCEFSSELWSQVRDWLGLKKRRMSTMSSAIKWMKKEVKGNNWLSKARRIAFAATVYYIWKARNLRIFEDTSLPVEECAKRIKTIVYKLLHGMYKMVIFPNGCLQPLFNTPSHLGA